MKNLVIVYGDNAHLMKAAAADIPAKFATSFRNIRYFVEPTPNTLRRTVMDVRIVACDEYTHSLAITIADAYTELHGEGKVEIMDIEHLQELSDNADETVREAQAQAQAKMNEPKGLLTAVKGIGEKTAQLLADNGITTIEQLAALDDDVRALEAVDGLGGIEHLAVKAQEHIDGY